MFGKSYREPKPEETSETTILNSSSTNPVRDDERRSPLTEGKAKFQSSVLENESETEISDVDSPEVVNTVEKISRIVSPYFIALVGLSLYKENFLIGTILVGTGILVLLKVSTKDLANLVKWIKNSLGFD